jgi:hypothetical protein
VVIFEISLRYFGISLFETDARVSEVGAKGGVCVGVFVKHAFTSFVILGWVRAVWPILFITSFFFGYLHSMSNPRNRPLH